MMGFLPKSLDTAAWLTALASVLEGEPWFLSRPDDGAGLTPRQVVILGRIAAGQANKLITRTFGITERTVKHHLAEIFERVNVSIRAQAVARASAKGWIGLPVALR